MKLLRKAILFLAAIVTITVVLNIPVTTKQGVNFVVSTKTIPLYAKLCGFLYRDYCYKDLSARIIKGVEGDVNKVTAIYGWTIDNIRKPPIGFPIVDDHIWDIIVRGYGTSDQAADVFTTLASYSGYEALWKKLATDKIPEKLIVSFVKINGAWHIFDVYNKIPFIEDENRKLSTPYGAAYSDYLEGLDFSTFSLTIKRPDKQKIVPRIIFEVKKITGFAKKTEK